MIRIFPSLIAADQLNLAYEIARLESYADGFHVDVMDGHFVPNITFGPSIVQSMARVTQKIVWVHLMVTDPLALCTMMCLPEESMITFHAELAIDFLKCFNVIKEKKWRPGIAINPKTGLEKIKSWLPYLDHVLIMSVNPGFSGQRFIPDVLAKVTDLIMMRQVFGYQFTVGIDGGVNKENASKIYQAGVEDWAIGTGIFEYSDPVSALEWYRNSNENKGGYNKKEQL